MASNTPSVLSPRERDVLQAIADGMTRREIASAFHLSHWTITDHLTRTRAKLRARTVAEAVAEGFRRGSLL